MSATHAEGRRVRFAPTVLMYGMTEGTFHSKSETMFPLRDVNDARHGATAPESVKRGFADRHDLFHSTLGEEKKRRVLPSSRRHSLRWMLSGMI